MNSKWSDTGILRKKQTKDTFDDLLVFGYACKLFRDDERALYIDQGKQLIPWMGDERLKIDRYDGRGALSDLSTCEASREGYDATRWLGLGESERKIEQLCDDERYYSLFNNEDEENMYKEEESKRQGSNEFQYNYDVPAYSENELAQDSVATCEEEDKPFIPPKELDVPVDIDIPKTVRENARIEKTAFFVSQHTPQMEILIKARQSDNPQFSFMNQNHPLQKYYRHLLNAFKTGQYKPPKEEPEENKEDDAPSHATENDHYLHPSLAMAGWEPAPQTVMPMPPVPTIQYKPTADCAYTQLVSRIKGNTIPVEKPQQAQETNTYNRNGQNISEQYYQYYQAQYYQYYRQIAQQYATQDNIDVNVVLQNPQLQEQIQQQAIQYAQAACAHFTFVQPPTPKPPEEETHATTPASVTATSNNIPSKPEQKFALVHYSSDSEEDEDGNEGDAKCIFIVPPSDIALIVDKMATYVSKNGPSFEKIVKDKGDVRFDFLNESHKYYKYYQHKVKEFSNYGNGSNSHKETTPTEPTEAIEEIEKQSRTKSEAPVKERKNIAPVSFSIKKPKEDTPKEIKSALPVEESDDEAVPHLEEHISEPPTMVPPPVVPIAASTISNTDVTIDPAIEESSSINKSIFSDDPIFEMIDLTDEAPNDKEKAEAKKLAEERIKDRLASAVRERALQMERKKRAALFLKMQSESSVKGSNKEAERITEDSSRIPKSGEVATHSESELEEGEIRHRSSKQKERRDSYHKKSSHKRSSKSRSNYTDSKSRHRKHKKRKQSSSHSSCTSSENE